MPSAKIEIRGTPKGNLSKFYTNKQSKVTRNVEKSERIYENVQINSKVELNNVTLIEVPYNAAESNKLKIVIQNFDKILDEFSKSPSKVPQKANPRFQRAKTCSIIESKCILKKSLSNPHVLEDSKSNLENGLTKSLSNMDFDSVTFDKKPPKPQDTKKNSPKPVQRSPKIEPPKLKTIEKPKIASKSPKPSPQSEKSKPIRQQRAPRLLKSVSTPKLSEEEPKTPFSVKLRKVPQKSPQETPKSSKPEILKPSTLKNKPSPTLSKAKSSWDVSMSKRPSKIPVKACQGLNKTLSPSIPTDLNEIGRKSLAKTMATKFDHCLDQNPLDHCLDRGQRLLKKIEELNGPKEGSQDKVSVKNVIARLESASKPPEKINSPSKKLEAFKFDITDTGEVKINKSKFGDLKKDCKTLFGTDHILLKKEDSLKILKDEIKNAKEIIKSINYISENTQVKADLILNKDLPKVDRDLEEFEKLEKKLQNSDYSSDCSDDSGNISNDLDCDIEEEILVLTPEIQIENAPEAPTFKNEIFFRQTTLTQLESLRDEKLQDLVISLQAVSRGYLARRRLQQRRLQDLAVRCIQRNVRKFMQVRDWPWWRLLVRVTPLLNVHRTEELLKIRTEELETLRAKVEKLDQERTSLKHDNDKLEAKLSEMTADLAEEHSTATLATERLDAETQERLRLEKEVDEAKQKNRSLQQSSERLEMELLYARSELNGLSEEDEDGDSDGVYKQRYERVARELEFTRRRLQQQHEDDLEQLVGLKKQLEKKLADAYEEVEEQRQVVGQWKRKVQKLNAETNDLRLLLEEQNARNNLLEKKQRKFDSETQLLQDELRQEKQTKERISREKEIILAEKYTLENNLADTRMELDLREEKLINLQKELDELTFGGKTEEEVTLLRKQKMELERKMHEQEEELDELAGQTQLLEQAKLRLEMSLEQIRKETKREAQQRDEELEEVRCNAQKKVKALEAQLENEHEERTLLLREKHELDRRLASLSESQRGDRAQEEAQLQRLRRDLKRTKALLRDAQTMIERYRADGTSRAVLRQLRNQLEDAECARSNAVKAKQQLEGELNEVQAQLEEAQRQRSEADDRFNSANRERTELRTQLEENEEELAEVLKKYRSAVQQTSVDQLTLQEQVSLVSELEAERNSLKERLAELTTKLETMESLGDPSSNLQAKKMELKCKELESKLELEQTTRSRLEVQIARLKETVEKLQSELVTSRTKEQQAQDQIRKLQRSLRELRDEYCATAARESESLQKRKELEKKIETCEAETSVAKADLKLALKRIDDLQSAIQGELEDTLSDHSESDPDSYSSDESIESFLANHKLGPSNSRNSIKLDPSPS